SEGAEIRTGMRYAGFWLRFGAYFLDGCIIVVSYVVCFAIVGLTVGLSGFAQPGLGLQSFLLIVTYGIPLVYEVFFIGTYGATLGKMACKIHVVTADGRRISYLRAVGRFFAKYLSGII